MICSRVISRLAFFKNTRPSKLMGLNFKLHLLPQPATNALLHSRFYSAPQCLYIFSRFDKKDCSPTGVVQLVLSRRALGTKSKEDDAAASDMRSRSPEHANYLNNAQNTTSFADPEARTKSELLIQAPSRLLRLWIHIKWPLTRNNRPFSLDDFSAFASWLVMGQALWIVLGTTTFVLSAMYLINAVDGFWKTINGGATEDGSSEKPGKTHDESFLSSLAGRVLSHGLGARIIFEKGHVLPHLEDGMLKFKNVTIYLIPKSNLLASLDFYARIASLNLSLSFKKWYNGKGLIYDMEVSGMHAKVDRNVIDSTPGVVLAETQTPTFNSLALSFSGVHDSHELQNDLSEHKMKELTNVTGQSRFSFLDSEYELAHVKIQDSFVEVHENHEDSSAFKISIFNCDLPRLRGDRMLIDFFNADIVTGTVNNSMFTIHKHQTLLGSDNAITFKLDGIDMGSLSRANTKLKFNWLVSGKAEIEADIRLPDFESNSPDPASQVAATNGVFLSVLGDLGNLTNPRPTVNKDFSGESSLLKGALMALYETFANGTETQVPPHNTDYVIVSAKVKFTDLKASLPPHLPMALSASVPFITLQNLRWLISYVNGLVTEKPLVIKTTVIERVTDLYNIDNISQTRIYDAIVGDIYDELLRMIKIDEKKIIEEKSNMWSHLIMSQILLLGLGVMA